MQTVSQSWIDQYSRPLLNRAHIELIFGVQDAATSHDASVSTTGYSVASFAKPEQILQDSVHSRARYTWLEQNYHTLDTNATILPIPSDAYVGYISDAGWDSSNPLSPPSGTLWGFDIVFSEIHNVLLPGVEIVFDPSKENPEMAYDFTVTVYNGSTVVTSASYTDNKESAVQVPLDNFTGFDKISVNITKWCLPYHRARVDQFTIGFGIIYNDEQILSFSHEMTCSPICSS